MCTSQKLKVHRNLLVSKHHVHLLDTSAQLSSTTMLCSVHVTSTSMYLVLIQSKQSATVANANALQQTAVPK